MNTTKCPVCGKPDLEVVMFQGYYYTNCCNEQLEPDFDEGNV